MIRASRQAVSHIRFCLQHGACQSTAFNIPVTWISLNVFPQPGESAVSILKNSLFDSALLFDCFFCATDEQTGRADNPDGLI
ncbi:MAG: hypothetical protein ABSF90_01430 [Syntrophobacteraceae bacterium]|jgi:hypothetical protein